MESKLLVVSSRDIVITKVESCEHYALFVRLAIGQRRVNNNGIASMLGATGKLLFI